MKCTLLASLALWSAITAIAQQPDQAPVISPGPVRNGADFSVISFRDELVFGSVARGSIFLLQGGRLGPEDLVVAQPPYPSRLPDTEGGTRIEVRSLVNEEVFNAPLLRSWTFQVAGIMPSSVPEGFAEVRVLRGDLASDPVLTEIVTSSPGIFTIGPYGVGPAAAQVYRSPVSQPLITLSGPARPGDTVILWATGLGPINGPDDSAPPIGTLRDDIRVRLGGIEIVPDYAGRAPGQPGLDQINFRLPLRADLPNHCYVPVSLFVGGDGFGSRATLSLGDATGVCNHPWGLSEHKLRELDEGGSTKVVDLQIRQFSPPPQPFYHPVRSTDIAAMLGVANAAGTAALSPRYRPPVSVQQPVDPCSPLFGVRRGDFGVWIDTPAFFPSRPPEEPSIIGLEVGGVQLLGPAGESYVLEPQSNQGEPSSDPFWRFKVGSEVHFPTAGDWTFRIDSGPDLTGLEHVVTLPDVDGFPTIPSLMRGQDQELTWDGGFFDENDWVSLSLTVVTSVDSDSERGRTFSCRVPARLGAMTIPGARLAELPESLDGSAQWHLQLDRRGEDGAFQAEGVDRATFGYGFSRAGLTRIE